MTQHVYLHAVTHLARGASAFDFRPVDGTPLIPFTAGAHADLILPNGVRRSYSLCNSQDETHRYVVGVKKASPSRGASVYLHDQLRIGAEIDIAPPRNNFSLVESAPHSVLIAGGIGVTPIWAHTSETRRARRLLGAALREPDPERRGVCRRAPATGHGGSRSRKPGVQSRSRRQKARSRRDYRQSALGLAFLRVRPGANARRLRKGNRRVAARAGSYGALRWGWRGDSCGRIGFRYRARAIRQDNSCARRQVDPRRVAR